MTVSQIKTLAEGLGYAVEGTLKADIISSFLAAQTAAKVQG